MAVVIEGADFVSGQEPEGLDRDWAADMTVHGLVVGEEDLARLLGVQRRVVRRRLDKLSDDKLLDLLTSGTNPISKQILKSARRDVHMAAREYAMLDLGLQGAKIDVIEYLDDQGYGSADYGKVGQDPAVRFELEVATLGEWKGPMDNPKRRSNSDVGCGQLPSFATYWIRTPSGWRRATQRTAEQIYAAPAGELAQVRGAAKTHEVQVLAATPSAYKAKSDVERGLGVMLWSWSLGPVSCDTIRRRIEAMTRGDEGSQFGQSYQGLSEALCGKANNPMARKAKTSSRRKRNQERPYRPGEIAQQMQIMPSEVVERAIEISPPDLEPYLRRRQRQAADLLEPGQSIWWSVHHSQLSREQAIDSVAQRIARSARKSYRYEQEQAAKAKRRMPDTPEKKSAIEDLEGELLWLSCEELEYERGEPSEYLDKAREAADRIIEKFGLYESKAEVRSLVEEEMYSCIRQPWHGYDANDVAEEIYILIAGPKENNPMKRNTNPREPKFLIMGYDGFWKARRLMDTPHRIHVRVRTKKEALDTAKKWMDAHPPSLQTAHRDTAYVSIEETKYGTPYRRALWEAGPAPEDAGLAPGYGQWVEVYNHLRSAKSKSKRNPKCPPGQIERAGYRREGYRRKGYRRSDGSYVDPAYVPPTTVPATCIPDPGTPGERARGAKGGVFADDPAWIQREGKLGGPGYTKKPQQTRRRLLAKCVREYGYESCLGSLTAVLRNTELKAKTRRIWESDKDWLVKQYGGPGSFSDNPRANPGPSPRMQLLARKLARG